MLVQCFIIVTVLEHLAARVAKVAAVVSVMTAYRTALFANAFVPTSVVLAYRTAHVAHVVAAKVSNMLAHLAAYIAVTVLILVFALCTAPSAEALAPIAFMSALRTAHVAHVVVTKVSNMLAHTATALAPSLKVRMSALGIADVAYTFAAVTFVSAHRAASVARIALPIARMFTQKVAYVAHVISAKFVVAGFSTDTAGSVLIIVLAFLSTVSADTVVPRALVSALHAALIT